LIQDITMGFFRSIGHGVASAGRATGHVAANSYRSGLVAEVGAAGVAFAATGGNPYAAGAAFAVTKTAIDGSRAADTQKEIRSQTQRQAQAFQKMNEESSQRMQKIAAAQYANSGLLTAPVPSSVTSAWSVTPTTDWVGIDSIRRAEEDRVIQGRIAARRNHSMGSAYLA
jgi:hypothetical protein